MCSYKRIMSSPGKFIMLFYYMLARITKLLFNRNKLEIHNLPWYSWHI